jgi:hypothetical protein
LATCHAGGDFHNGLDYIIYNKGLSSEGAYPYVGHDTACNASLEHDHQAGRRLGEWAVWRAVWRAVWKLG